MTPPQPFEIQNLDGIAVASNGVTRVCLTEPDGRMFRRRGITGISSRTAAETLVPQLNALAGELLANPTMSAAEALARLHAIGGGVQLTQPQNVEWCVTQVGDVRVYVDAESVIVTRQDIGL
jgi:hypothetical protein